MSYYLQKRCLHSGVWERIDSDSKALLELLEERDQLNQDIDPGLRSFGPRYRVVDDSGTVHNYSYQEAAQ